MSSQTIRNKSYTRRGNRDYHGYIHDRYCRRDSSLVDGGFKIHGYTSDLVVTIPADFANRIKKAGSSGLQSTIVDFMGEPDDYGLHNCVLLDITEEEADIIRVNENLANDCTLDVVIKKNHWATKVFHSWEPTNTTIELDNGKMLVIYKDFEGEEILRVYV